MLQKPRVIVTGSSGTVGKVIVEGLKQTYDIIEVDINLKEESNNKLCVNIADSKQIRTKLNKLVNVDQIIHLAADPHPDASWESVLQNNIIGTKNIYDLAVALKARRVIYSSSNQVSKGYYNNTQNLSKVSEDLPFRPQSYYAASKAMGEVLARTYYEIYKMNSICIRLGTVIKSNIPKSGTDFVKWLSHRDLVQLMEKCLESNIEYGVYFGSSNNKDVPWDLKNSFDDLGYQPLDDGSKFL